MEDILLALYFYLLTFFDAKEGKIPRCILNITISTNENVDFPVDFIS